MVSSINSINRRPFANYKELEVIRRLESLGINSSDNLLVDRQNLQVAELKKKQSTLATNSEVNLYKIKNSGQDFLSTIKGVAQQGVVQKSDNIFQENGLIENRSKLVLEGMQKNYQPQFEMVGATQIAQLNKLKLGLIA